MTEIDQPTSINASKATSGDSYVSFWSKLSHELKTQIHGISGLSTYLNENWDSLNEETRKRCVHGINSASKTLNELSDTLMKGNNGSKIKFEFQALDLVDITKDFVSSAKELYIHREEIDFSIKSLQSECFASIDLFWYKRLLHNLTSNSINYSKKGAIIIEIDKQKIDGTEFAVISVHDEGVGIPENELKNIFDPFNRSAGSEMYENGTGLGLAICHEIVSAHGGQISAYNNEEIGSTVEFTLPIYTNLD